MTAPLRNPAPISDPQQATPVHAGAPPAPPAAHDAPHGTGELDFELPPPAHVTPIRAIALGAMVLVLLAAAFLIRWLPTRHAQAALATETNERNSATLRVQVTTPTVVSSDRSISLPGTMSPFEETVIYPRTSGYVRRWLADLGDKVKEGDVLAEIDTPDLDQQINQARAQVAQSEASLLQARANAEYSKGNLARNQQMLPKGLISQQTFEQAKAQAGVDQASIAVAEANIGSMRANLQYLGQLKTFSHIVAPFSGTITLRNIEKGTLLTAGNSTSLFRISALDPVRVFVQVPQDVAPNVHLGLTAGVTIREFPGQVFEGKVAHAEGALEPATRTMMVEVRVPNPKGELLTGMFAQVAFTLPTPHRVMSVPATALLNGADGLRVAVVDSTDHVHLVKVAVERDTGATVEISTGLQAEDRVVKLPSADLTEGKQVEIAR
jgi:membrane fusion protein (multidrug efflux system)